MCPGSEPVPMFLGSEAVPMLGALVPNQDPMCPGSEPGSMLGALVLNQDPMCPGSEPGSIRFKELSHGYEFRSGIREL